MKITVTLTIDCTPDDSLVCDPNEPLEDVKDDIESRLTDCWLPHSGQVLSITTAAVDSLS